MNGMNSIFRKNSGWFVLGLVVIMSGLSSVTGEAAVIAHGGRARARVTFYYPHEGCCGMKAVTGEKLQPWRSCAVDPRIIPLGSEVDVPGIGKLLAHDTGSAVVSRKAAQGFKEHLIVIDVCVANAQEMARMSRQFPPVVEIRRL